MIERFVCVLEGHYRTKADHAESFGIDLTELSNQLFGKAIAEIFLLNGASLVS